VDIYNFTCLGSDGWQGELMLAFVLAWRGFGLCQFCVSFSCLWFLTENWFWAALFIETLQYAWICMEFILFCFDGILDGIYGKFHVFLMCTSLVDIVIYYGIQTTELILKLQVIHSIFVGNFAWIYVLRSLIYFNL
jgi:hypothetical protein